MKVVIEQNEAILHGPARWDVLAEHVGLRGNALPALPHETEHGTVRAYVETRPSLGAWQAHGEPTEGVNAEGAWEKVWPVVDMPLEQAKAKALSTLADIRWQHEVGGTMLGDWPIQTDRETRANYLAGVLTGQTDPTFEAQWKLMDGNFVTFSAETFQQAMGAVLTHVADCFAVEEVKAGQIKAATTVDELRAIDLDTGWPE